MSKEVDINGKNYGENTKITLSVKTLIWIVGLLIAGLTTLATIGYYDIKEDVSTINADSEQSKEDYKEEIEKIIEDILKEDRDKREELIETIGEMKGDIKVILDRTSRNNDHNNSGDVNPIDEDLNGGMPDGGRGH